MLFVSMALEIREIILNGPNYFFRNVSIISVIFGYHEKQLKVLLQRPARTDKWVLPVGYIMRTETIDEAASRTINSRTKLKYLHLKQFKSFSKQTIWDENLLTPILNNCDSEAKLDSGNWLLEDFVSIGYYTLTEFSKVKPSGEYLNEECKWWEIINIPELMFDHLNIINEALSSLRIDIHHFPIGIELLPNKFTLPEIHRLYETILDRKLDYRNFSKKLIATGIINKLDEKRNIGAHRSPNLYVFNKEKYKNKLDEGLFMTF
jgi:ADP-ribose pyrophosphatase YjhB (NUDIX family)